MPQTIGLRVPCAHVVVWLVVDSCWKVSVVVGAVVKVDLHNSGLWVCLQALVRLLPARARPARESSE